MADEPSGSATPPADPPPGQPPNEPQQQTDEPQDAEGWRAALRRANRESADRRRQLAALEAERDELRKAQMSEIDREREGRTTAERERDELRTSIARMRVAMELQLPPELAERVVGADEDAMREDAKRLVALLRPAGNLGGGMGGTPPAPSADDMNARIRAAVGR